MLFLTLTHELQIEIVEISLEEMNSIKNIHHLQDSLYVLARFSSLKDFKSGPNHMPHPAHFELYYLKASKLNRKF